MDKVFVYGTLKEGHHNHRLLKSSTKVGDFTTPPVFSMYSLGGFPGVELSGNTAVQGEVYEVDEETMKRLDGLEGYPTFYNRVKIDTIFGDAWMYFLEDCEKRYRATKMKEGVW